MQNTLLPTALLAVALVAGLSGACDSDDDAGPITAFDHPGVCDKAPAIGAGLRLGQADVSLRGYDASCRFVTWIGAEASGSSIHVWDIEGGFGYRTAAADRTRWGVSLHGHWLAYAEGTGVVIEHLDRYERATLTPIPAVNERVAFRFPRMAWIAGDGTAAVYVADIRSGDVDKISPEGASCSDVALSDQHVAYVVEGGTTAWIDVVDLDVPEDGALTIVPVGRASMPSIEGTTVVYEVDGRLEAWDVLADALIDTWVAAEGTSLKVAPRLQNEWTAVLEESAAGANLSLWRPSDLSRVARRSVAVGLDDAQPALIGERLIIVPEPISDSRLLTVEKVDTN